MIYSETSARLGTRSDVTGAEGDGVDAAEEGEGSLSSTRGSIVGAIEG